MSRPRKRGLVAVIALWVVLLYVVGLLVGVLIHALLGDRYWWSFLLSTFTLYFFAPLPAIVVLAVLSRNRIAWLLCATAVLLCGYFYGALFMPKIITPERNGTELTVMTFNVLFHNQHPERVVAAICASHADLIGLQEVNPGIAESIEHGLKRAYPYQMLRPSASDASGMGVISRYPLRPQPDHLPGTWLSTPQILSLDLQGTRVTVLNLHPVSTLLQPTPLEREARERVVTADAIVRYAHAHAGPLVVTTDFNVGDQSTPYAIVTGALGDSWREAGWGFGHTFPGALSPGSSRPIIFGIPVPKWLIRIDFVFHSRDWRAEWAHIGPWDGVSDHRPVLIRLVLPRVMRTHS